MRSAPWNPLSWLSHAALLALAVAAVGCGVNVSNGGYYPYQSEDGAGLAGDATPSGDGGATPDTLSEDSLGSDGQGSDAGSTDSTVWDSGGYDSGSADVVLQDGNPWDANSEDAPKPYDTWQGDAWQGETWPYDTGSYDTGSYDTWPYETWPYDSGSYDTWPSDTWPSDTWQGDASYDLNGNDVWPDVPPDASAHSCCQSGAPSCSDGAIASCVCSKDIYCCNTAWDSTCVNEVSQFGCGTCASSDAWGSDGSSYDAGSYDSGGYDVPPYDAGSDASMVCEPICGAIGSKSEGWFDSCSMTPIYTAGGFPAWDQCKNCSALCEGVGTSSEGWYSNCSGKLIVAGPCM